MESKPRTLSMLLLAESRSFADSIEEDLADAGREWFHLARAAGVLGLVDQVADLPPHAVLLDWHCPGMTPALISNLRLAAPTSAIIILLRPEDTNIGAAALRAGAEECVCAANLNPKAIRTLLINAVQRHLLRLDAQSDAETQRKRLERLIQFDDETGLNNAGYITDRVEREILRSMRYGNRLSLAVLDLLDGQEIEAAHGPQALQAALRRVAAGLKQAMRRIDEVASLGGGRFAALCVESDGQQALIAMERALAGIESREFELAPGKRIGLGLACGVAEWNRAIPDADCLTHAALQALHRALDDPPGRRLRLAEGPPA